MAEAAAGALDGRYRLERELGRGGFARVYLATDLRLGRAVAVKALDAQLAAQAPERDFAVRFDREAHAVAALHHPHILPVYDYGAAGGALYLVMPYVAGGSLADLLRREGPLSPARASHYLAQIAGALDYAHRRGVVHRDLKPANLLLDEGDRLLLADFGIAKLLGEAGATTGQTGVVGTPSYMPPEQFQGRVGPPTDIYALGCLLYELLTGAPPYGGTTEQVIYGHLYGAIPSLAERTGGRAPAALQPVLERAMAKWPEERYPTAGDLAGAVAAALAAPAPAPASPAAGWAPTVPAPPGWAPPASAVALPAPAVAAVLTPPAPAARAGGRPRWPDLALASGVVAVGLVIGGNRAAMYLGDVAAGYTSVDSPQLLEVFAPVGLLVLLAGVAAGLGPRSWAAGLRWALVVVLALLWLLGVSLLGLSGPIHLLLVLALGLLGYNLVAARRGADPAPAVRPDTRGGARRALVYLRRALVAMFFLLWLWGILEGLGGVVHLPLALACGLLVYNLATAAPGAA